MKDTKRNTNLQLKKSKAQKIKKNEVIEEEIDEEFEEMLMNISLKKPKSAYIIFCQAEWQKIGKEDRSKDITEVSKTSANKWKIMRPEEKLKYDKEAEQDQRRYKKEIKIVRKNLIDDPVKEINHLKNTEFKTVDFGWFNGAASLDTKNDDVYKVEIIQDDLIAGTSNAVAVGNKLVLSSMIDNGVMICDK